MFTNDHNINKIKEVAVNDLKAIWRATLTVDSTIQTLETDLAAIKAAGKGSPKAADFSVVSDELDLIVARYTLEGTDPVATTTGEPMYNKDKVRITEYWNLERFKITEEDAAYTTTIEITYYK